MERERENIVLNLALCVRERERERNSSISCSVFLLCILYTSVCVFCSLSLSLSISDCKVFLATWKEIPPTNEVQTFVDNISLTPGTVVCLFWQMEVYTVVCTQCLCLCAGFGKCIMEGE